MTEWTSTRIRDTFSGYFGGKGHRVIPSAPLVPEGDPTLLFINAGMAPFKKYFLGTAAPPATRLASCQKCLRTVDIEKVGATPRHLTFFEMLGNFSFGDYFKEEAIAFAWELLTDRQKGYGMDPARLWFTIYEDDDEAGKLWQKIAGVKPERILARGADDNFWTMGDTGPCGPCSEVIYDFRDHPGAQKTFPNEDSTPPEGVEIWNLVFTQFDKQKDGSLKPLPKKNVDTGAGLERIAWALQGVHSVFETDFLREWMNPWSARAKSLEQGRYAHIIGDHIRAAAFAVKDGVRPSNTDRGYVVRRILRRAELYATKLGLEPEQFAHHLHHLLQSAGPFPPGVRKAVSAALVEETSAFARTLGKGEAILRDVARSASSKFISGEDAFKLYDTYGFPLELTKELAAEKGLTVDEAGFRAEMEKQRERGRSARKQTTAGWEESGEAKGSAFVGYDRTTENATITLLRLRDAKASEGEPSKDDEPDVQIALDRTPFYAESGGQIGDSGVLKGPGFLVKVLDTKKEMGTTLHYGKREWGVPVLGEKVVAQVDADRRNAIRRAHTATHLLHAALHQIIGESATQAGSLVAPDYLRFDFHAAQATPPDTLAAIETLVNTWGLEGHRVFPHPDVPLEQAKQMGAIMLFGEKYGEKVRVMEIEGKDGQPISRELCGGVHLDNTLEVGFFKITSEESIGAGIRRIEAVTGLKALDWAQSAERVLKALSHALAAPIEKIEEKFAQFNAKAEADEKEIARLKDQDIEAKAIGLIGQIGLIVAKTLPDLDAKSLSEVANRAAALAPGKAFVLGASVRASGTASLVVALGRDVKGVSARAIVQSVAPLISGGGGGKDNFAQAGGKDPSGLDAAIQKAVDEIRKGLPA